MDYWVHVMLHPGVLVSLLDDIVVDAYLVEEPHAEDYRRIRELCDRYADADLGFVGLPSSRSWSDSMSRS